MKIATLKSIDQLQPGDQFLTLGLKHEPAKLTVRKIDNGRVLVEEFGGVDLALDEYYVLEDQFKS